MYVRQLDSFSFVLTVSHYRNKKYFLILLWESLKRSLVGLRVFY